MRGFFFTSKAVSWFALESGTLRWVVDNERVEVGLIEVHARQGTSVRCEVSHDSTTRLEQVFDAYTKDFAFTSSRAIVKLFEHGVDFVSRSEAKRLARGLERFEEVVVDFTRIEGIGQGFADELFRVWAAAHPATRLVPVHMNRAVSFFVDRAWRSSGDRMFEPIRFARGRSRADRSHIEPLHDEVADRTTPSRTARGDGA